ncbi:MAG: energy-coupling factor transporter transmembrane component T [Eubacteriales bacterium]|nr:energy-coupling factor transporter transmembrane component T [Eubacteriales bacterium]
MLRDITLGQYYPAKSVIHQLDPRVKLVTTMIFIISLFVAKGAAGYVIATVFLAAVIRMSKVPFRFMTKGLKAIMMLLLVTVAFNLFLIDGDVVLWRFGFLRITDKGVRTAIFMAVRLIYLILGSSVMTLTTTPNDLTDGLEKLLGPLKVLRVPVHEISMIMSIALRFIPILLEETDKIMKAQIARGADFESGNLIQKAKAMVPLLVPLFISAFRRANDLAMAMEARCYRGGEGRTKMKPLHYESRDRMAYAVVWGYLAVMIVAGRLLAGYFPFS